MKFVKTRTKALKSYNQTLLRALARGFEITDESKTSNITLRACFGLLLTLRAISNQFHLRVRAALSQTAGLSFCYKMDAIGELVTVT